MTPRLAMRGIWKSFSGVPVLKGIQFDVREGEIHALVGENGAGKSTLMHILAGVHQPESGTLELGGQRVVFDGERAAQRHGIAMVFQERSLFNTLSVAQNVFAGRQPVKRFGWVDHRRLCEETRALLNQVELAVEPEAPLSGLSPAQQQMVEIAKALSLRARWIIFDEPTAALTDAETRALFAVIARLKQQGAGIIYISHRLEEIFQIADRVTVLKDGEGQGTLAISETNPADLVRRMVGRDLKLQREISDSTAMNPAVLEVEDLSDPPSESTARTALRTITFVARAGEVLAFAGLAGAGRTELALSIFGARPRGTGKIKVGGRPVEIHSPGQAIRAGIGYLPEDRKEAGLFLEMGIAQNIAAARLERFGKIWLAEREQVRVAAEFREQLRIASRDVNQPMRTLSGGNQQKAMLARWLLVNPLVLIVDEPTRGIDVGAKSEVHGLLRGLAKRGTAVIMISSDLPEVLAVADRILVLREGRIAGEVPGSRATEESIMRLATLPLNH